MTPMHALGLLTVTALLPGHLSAQDTTKSSQQIVLRTCYLSTPVAGARSVSLRVTMDADGGSGVLTLDPNRYRVDAFGDRTVGTKIGLQRIPVRLARANVEDPKNQGRSLLRLEASADVALPAPVTLVLDRARARSRLLWGGGADVQVLALEAASTGASTASDPKTREVTAAGLTLSVPPTWRQQKPSSSMRVMQFGLPAAEAADAPELAVFRFPGGGSVDANVQRWIGQFRPEGRTSKVTTGSARGRDYVVVDVTGTYNKPIGPPMRRKSTPVSGQRMFAVILQPDDGGGLYFLKAVGGRAAIAAAAADIRASFGGDAAAERPRK